MNMKETLILEQVLIWVLLAQGRFLQTRQQVSPLFSIRKGSITTIHIFSFALATNIQHLHDAHLIHLLHLCGFTSEFFYLCERNCQKLSKSPVQTCSEIAGNQHKLLWNISRSTPVDLKTIYRRAISLDGYAAYVFVELQQISNFENTTTSREEDFNSWKSNTLNFEKNYV